MAYRGVVNLARVLASAVVLAAGCGKGDDDDASAAATGSDACASVNEGDPCSNPGAECSYGDDCGSSDYRCENGAWVWVGGSTCGDVPVACADAPMPGDNCRWNDPVCDPDGDCQDVLECIQGVWTFYEQCSAEFCAAAEPVADGPCAEPGRTCPDPCVVGEPVFFCQTTGWRELGGCCDDNTC